ncbi:MAG: hypothetical protein MJE68_01165, partial [Proteobacteria bacterium]|nr:hypothetical protein [Pseudomonadota bacterium]
FVTAKSTTKITKISTPRKLPAIRYYAALPFTGISKINIIRFGNRLGLIVEAAIIDLLNFHSGVQVIIIVIIYNACTYTT